MESILVKTIYNVDTIGKNNGKAWQKLTDYMDNNPDKDIEFDFKGIELYEPWATPEFVKFIQNEHVHMKLHINEIAVNSINMMCKLIGVSNNRVVNVDPVIVEKPSKEMLKIAEKAESLQRLFEDNDEGIVDFLVSPTYHQIGNGETVQYFEAAIKKYASEHKVEQINIKLDNIVIQDNVIEAMTKLIELGEGLGFTIKIDSDDSKVMNKIGMYKSLSTNNVSTEQDKIRLIKSNLNTGKVGMLIKYKESRSTDEFGRSGKGEPVSCRVAIYQGMKKVEGSEIHVFFRTYNGNTFYTRAHWALEHDNNLLEHLDYDDIHFPISEFGMYNEFLGSRYHLINPIQQDINDSTIMYGVDEDGRVTHTTLTIPERIKAVFDDWDINYDSESILYHIQRTKEILDKQQEEMD